MVQKGGTILLNLATKKVALIYRESDCGYTFPKGHEENDEAVQTCAMRETEEETLRDNILLSDTPVDIIKYKNETDGEVEVYYFISLDLGPSEREIPEKDREICEWFDYNEVRDKLAYENLIDMWDKIKEPIKKFLESNGKPDAETLRALGIQNRKNK